MEATNEEALNTLGIQMQTHERYHTQKENMTWLATVAYLGLTVVLVGREPFWKPWPVECFIAWFMLLLATAASMLVFLYWQFRARHAASALFLSANDIATRWHTSPPDRDDLQPKSLRELDNMLVFAAVEEQFGKVFRLGTSWMQRVTLLLIVSWSVAAAAYVLATYLAGCAP